MTNLTPKKKAEELIESFISYCSDEETSEDGFIYSDNMQLFNAKQCALVAVNEILNLEPPEESYLEPFSKSWWQEVEQQIKKL